MEIPQNVKGNLEIKPVKWIDEVLQFALRNMPQPQAQPIVVAPEVVEAKPAKRTGRRQGERVAH